MMGTGATRLRLDAGFTLAELMIIVVIIAVLLAIAIVSYASATRAADAAVCKHNRQVLEEAAHINQAKADGTPFLTLADLAPFVRDYDSVCECPSDDSPYLFDSTTFELTCLNHDE